MEDDFPNLLFAKDGEIFDLEGHKAIVLGGAYSVDIAFVRKIAYFHLPKMRRTARRNHIKVKCG